MAREIEIRLLKSQSEVSQECFSRTDDYGCDTTSFSRGFISWDPAGFWFWFWFDPLAVVSSGPAVFCVENKRECFNMYFNRITAVFLSPHRKHSFTTLKHLLFLSWRKWRFKPSLCQSRGSGLLRLQVYRLKWSQGKRWCSPGGLRNTDDLQHLWRKVEKSTMILTLTWDSWSWDPADRDWRDFIAFCVQDKTLH